MQAPADRTTKGDCTGIANMMNKFFLSVSEHLPRLCKDNHVCTINDGLRDHFIITVDLTLSALQTIKLYKSTGPDNITA